MFLSKILGLEWHEGEYDGRLLYFDLSFWVKYIFLMFCLSLKLFLDVGNKNSNSFWKANLPPEDKLCEQSSLEQRASFIRRKYKKRKYKKVLEGPNTQEELNKVCVREPVC